MSTGLTEPATASGVRERVDDALAAFLDSRTDFHGRRDFDDALDLVGSHLLGGGKRIRPRFCYWGWRGAGGPDCDEIVTAAAALELFHAFALMQDDVIDRSDLRRGAPTVHIQAARMHERHAWRGDAAVFGDAVGMLLGDLCLVWADEMLRASGLDTPRARCVYERMRVELICGQYLDMLEAARGPSTVERSLRVVRLKAASYTVQRPLQLGGALAGAADDLMDSYADLGTALGEAFQLRDDVLGVFGDPAVTGKPVLDDLREGKPTVLMAYAWQHACPDGRDRIARLHGNPALDEEGAAELRGLLVESGAPAAVERMIEDRTARALGVLRRAPIDETAREALADLIVAATRRSR